MNVVVLGGNGFIGHHLAKRLKSQGHYVTVCDIKRCEYGTSHADEIILGDLRDIQIVEAVVRSADRVFQLAADMGGCQYVFTGEHDADIMRNSAQINMNVCDALVRLNPKAKVFYSSSACMYPQHIQSNPDNPGLKELDAYPGNPDSEYGWEKLFSERIYMSYYRNYGLDVRIARYHNIYGPEGTYKGGKEKAPASISRKVAEAKNKVQIWGAGNQTRSFLYIDDCIDATLQLMEADWVEPINIGSEESISINDLWEMVIDISGKRLIIEHIKRPTGTLGVMGRNSNNDLIRKVLNWEPKYKLYDGMVKTFAWIKEQIENR